jgi:Fur family iron response transcriptional regulator
MNETGRDGGTIPLARGTACLRSANIRPTRQRTALAALLAGKGPRHVTADQLHREAMDNGVRMSLATVYNTLHEFSDAGLLRRVPAGEKTAFCTSTHMHHHFFHEDTGLLEDIPASLPAIGALPEPPPGTEIASVEVIVRLRPKR